MKWLVSAFEPFDQATSNSSLIVCNELRQLDWGSKVRFHVPVPVEFVNGWRNLEKELRLFPDVEGVLALGQAEGRTTISLECVALNWIDSCIADNSGVTPPIGPISEREAPARFSPIPWQKFEARSGVSARSYSAGTFVCNELMFNSLEWAERNKKLAGFVHIPLLDVQEKLTGEFLPRMELNVAVTELRRILQFLTSL